MATTNNESDALQGPLALELDSADVIRVVLQFLREQGLSESLASLQKETGIPLNAVDSVDSFVSNISKGRWDAVLKTVSTLSIPPVKIRKLYEHIVKEMLELREVDTALALLKGAQAFVDMRRDEPERFATLHRMANQGFFDAEQAYPGSNREEQRAELAKSLADEVAVVPPGRLLTLLGDALKWQRSQGKLPRGSKFDIFRATAPRLRDESEKQCGRLGGQLSLGAKSHPECAVFTPDGMGLATGSVDGFIEIWDPDTLKVRLDLDYQAKDKFMMHNDAILCLAFSKDGDMLASGSRDGLIKVWKVATGACLRKLPAAHPQGITSLCFAGEGTQIISGSFDGTARMHGLRSAKMLKEYREHASYVNDVKVSMDGSKLITASSDGDVKIWNLKTSECLVTCQLPQPTATAEVAVNTILPLPKSPDRFLVCSRSCAMFIIDLKGAILHTLSNEDKKGSELVDCALSQSGRFAYAAGENGKLYIFDMESKTLEKSVELGEGEVIGIAHHPQRNLLASYSSNGALRLWRP